MNESRDYKSSNRNRRMPRRMRERESSKKRREIYLLIACLLLAMNVLLLLRTRAQIKGLNKALSQVSRHGLTHFLCIRDSLTDKANSGT